ncbi:dynamin [Paenibacillus sp. CAA11]|uniref:dynamin family protein n=1 Tax=Paenibacillus sp. CAA11 TaxID=1532905 RepID=UPI000D3D5EF3|nr:dynamin family protein [Paenibacillus sp. CAA11]AWB44939.1 dynamin [Paenibacillus sp. CAA11]
MEAITEKSDSDGLLNFQALKQALLDASDLQAADGLVELADKWERGELMLAFCGHFSAGKSSLINTLCGKQVLPTSPLPTSSNIVMVRCGAPRGALTRPDHQEEHREEHKCLTRSELFEACKNGQEYSRVEIWDDVPLLGERGVLIDTPGVDSTDEGHALATDSALHLADIVFYVMDYNHVQSESNLSFAKSLSEWGKPLYLVVNQIDKHREKELSFQEYQQRVEASFSAWNVIPAGIFYLSLKVPGHPWSMLGLLEDLIRALVREGDRLLKLSLALSVDHLMNDHLGRQRALHQAEREKLLEQMGGKDEIASLEQQLQQLEEDSSSLELKAESLRRESIQRMDQLLAGARLMTPPLREAAAAFLESTQPGFKARGWLKSGQRTQEEKARRCNLFLQALREQASAQIDWHLREEFRRLGQQQALWNEAWEKKLDETLPKPEESWMLDAIPSGAVLSGESVLRYTEALASEVLARYRRAAVSLLDQLLEEMKPRLEAEQRALQQRRFELEARVPYVRQLRELEAAAAEHERRLYALLGERPPAMSGLLPQLPAAAAKAPGPAQPAGPSAPAAAAVPGTPKAVPGESLSGAPLRGRTLKAAAALEHAAELLEQHPAMESGVQELKQRAEALRRGRLTLTLFGAFSAGKSSFANALLGEEILPVSPHPTTASITRVLAPTDEFPHGTARVIFKTREAMVEDLTYSFGVLQLGQWQEQDWRQQVSGLKAASIPAAGRPHYSFLAAAAAGWNQEADKLGSSQAADFAQFQAYAAVEQKACFVAGIDIYFACPWTEQGQILVDTPGADSIHARHTNITFQYMKNSDAILFITYYNHAFSRADQQFLAQLGRVKGSFALDKMFFIVNAADLAAGAEELDKVVAYVSDRLRTAGIQSPQIYPVSSMKELEAVQSGASSRDKGFTSFKDSFVRFLAEDLADLSVSSAAFEIERAAHRLKSWCDASQRNARDQALRIQQLDEERHRVLTALEVICELDVEREWMQECEELLFHLRQRLVLYALGLFHEFFHPSLLQTEKGGIKSAFRASMEGWLSHLSVELARELQATALRLERKADQLLTREVQNWCLVHQPLTEMPLSLPELQEEWITPQIPEEAMVSAVDWQAYWSFFKNPKSFFEGDGKDKLREAVQSPLTEAIKQKLDQMLEFFCSHYKEGIRYRLAMYQQRLSSQLEEWLSGFSKTSMETAEIQHWESIYFELLETKQQLV